MVFSNRTAVVQYSRRLHITNATERLQEEIGWLEGVIRNFTNREFAWAANPSDLGTHWFVEEEDWDELRIIDLGRTVLSSNYASYYNYDFVLPFRTDVYHKLTIEGYRTGTYKVYADYDASGEGSFLLRFKVIEW